MYAVKVMMIMLIRVLTILNRIAPIVILKKCSTLPPSGASLILLDASLVSGPATYNSKQCYHNSYGKCDSNESLMGEAQIHLRL